MAFVTEAYAAKNYGDMHNAIFVNTIDGKRIVFTIPGVHPLLGDNITVLLRGLETPDMHAGCRRERERASQARDILTWLMKRASKITLKNVDRGRSFQVVATVFADGKDIREVLVKKGLAVWNTGRGHKKDWCS